MYCPKCFNSSLNFNTRGIIHVIINGKQMDSGRFLYNLDHLDDPQFLNDLKDKVEEFFKWYSQFQNQEVITTVELCTSDVVCENKCAIAIDQKFSILDVMVRKQTLIKILNDLSSKYGVKVELAR
ncbi:hypothetical protein M899_2602 [Bacteriovorax sp. BSW11_IV]|uniref:hypothetical protein n=1 Tax=Bacteriovorax sp. BSW11_IV TaxID=1353529 RepID=UPI00038A114C|nr:hypothetical protein [Bacteriovorax sp. BSW11_IV]EQC49864.1 hypothetical protein M899_2602 [Bacteriovorax sp. BSW11_IV]